VAWLGKPVCKDQHDSRPQISAVGDRLEARLATSSRPRSRASRSCHRDAGRWTSVAACFRNEADGQIHELELNAIIKMGKLLDVPEDIVRQLKVIYHEEQALRQRRIKLALPDGLP